MAKKPTISTVASGYQGTATINSNFQNIRDQFDNTLSRDGSTPNAMLADLDMNGYSILNVGASLGGGILTVDAADARYVNQAGDTMTGNLTTPALYTNGLYINGNPVVPSTLTYNGIVKETKIATSGQTVFNLTSISYTPGINNLAVYVDGVYQRPANYTETNATRVTFSVGLHVGAIVDFVVLTINSLSGTADATNLTYTAPGAGAQSRTVYSRLSDIVSVKDFGAVGDGVADDTAAVQAAFTAANGSKTVFFPDGSYRITSPVDCKASSFFGQSMYGSIILCHVSNARTLTNTGRSISNLTFNGDGFATADALEIDGYLTNINQCYFYKVRDAICPIAIIVTSTVNQCLFLTCNSAINDKLHDGTSAHTTLWFTSNSVQYGTHAFVIKTQAAGMYFSGNVFEQLDYVYYSFGQQLFSDVWIKNWFEQISSNLTIFYNTFSGGTSVKIENDVRPGGYTITDAAKMAPTQFATTGTSGNAGGVIINDTGIRVSTFNTEAGYIFDAYGIKTAALTATFTTTNDFTISTMSGNGTQANRGGDIVADLGVGTFAQRNGCIRSSADNTYSIGSTDFRWANAYVTQLRPGAGTVIWTSGAGSPEGVVTAPVGSLFTRTDGGAGTTLYVKQSGTGNTGWAAK